MSPPVARRRASGRRGKDLRHRPPGGQPALISAATATRILSMPQAASAEREGARSRRPRARSFRGCDRRALWSSARRAWVEKHVGTDLRQARARRRAARAPPRAGRPHAPAGYADGVAQRQLGDDPGPAPPEATAIVQRAADRRQRDPRDRRARCRRRTAATAPPRPSSVTVTDQPTGAGLDRRPTRLGSRRRAWPRWPAPRQRRNTPCSRPAA